MSLVSIQEAVRQAYESGAPLAIRGGSTQTHLSQLSGDLVSTAEYSGVIDYRPEELMIRVKAGTRLSEIHSLLRESGQILGFEPPVYGAASTIGGSIAANTAGNRRPYSGAARDAILGVGLVLQTGEYAEFGGQVMKNVAGYDVARLICGSYGALGVIADVSLKLLPAPQKEMSLALISELAFAKNKVASLWRQASNCLSAAAYVDEKLCLRFSGDAGQVERVVAEMNGEELTEDFWEQLNRQSHPALAAGDLWRLSTTAADECDLPFVLQDWGFAQRWLINPEADPRGNYNGPGHWTRFREDDQRFKAPRVEPMHPAMASLQNRIKQAFDERNIFNPEIFA